MHATRKYWLIGSLLSALLPFSLVEHSTIAAQPAYAALPTTGGIPGPSARGVRVSLAAMRAESPQPGLSRSASITSTFPGLSYCGPTNCSNPPDGGFAVGPQSLVQAINRGMAVYSRTGQLEVGLVPFRTFFNHTGGANDPRAIYDAGNALPGGIAGGHGRFVVTAVSNQPSLGISNYVIAVSQNENPLSATSGWCTYAINGAYQSGGVTAFTDFDNVGMDSNNLYITSEELTFSSPHAYVHSRLLVIPKASVYPDATTGACPAITSTDYEPLTNPDGSLARDVEPANQPDAVPGQTTPMYFVDTIEGGGNHVALRTVTLTPSLQLNAPTWIPVAAYTPPTFVPEPNGSPILTSDDDVVNALYRYGSIYFAIGTGRLGVGTGAANPYSNVQWYQVAANTFAVTSNSITDPNIAFFTPDIMVGCSVTTETGTDGSSTCASPFVTLAVSGAGPNQPASAYYALNGAAPVQFAAGVAGYSTGTTPTLWGDYPGVSADPLSPGAVWFSGEFAQTATAWGTEVVAVRPSGVAIELAPTSGAPGSTVDVSGNGFAAGESIAIKFACGSVTCNSRTITTTTADNSGRLTNVPAVVPTTASLGAHTMAAVGETSGAFASTTFHVLATPNP